MSEALAHFIYTDIAITIMIKHAKCKLKVLLIDKLHLVRGSIHELRIANLSVAVLVYSSENCLPIKSTSLLSVLGKTIINLRCTLPHLFPTNVTIVVRVHRLKLLSKLAMVRLIALIPHEET